MNEPQNPPAVRLGESLSKVLAYAGSNREAELRWRQAVYLETIRVQKGKGVVAAGAYYNCGVINLEWNQYGEARSNFKAAIRLDSNDKAAQQNLDFVKSKLSTSGKSDKISPVLTFRYTIETYMRINANTEGRSLDSPKCVR